MRALCLGTLWTCELPGCSLVADHKLQKHFLPTFIPPGSKKVCGEKSMSVTLFQNRILPGCHKGNLCSLVRYMDTCGQGVSEVSFSPFFQVFPISTVTGRQFRPSTISSTGRSGRLFWVKAAERVGFLLLLPACLFTNN